VTKLIDLSTEQITIYTKDIAQKTIAKNIAESAFDKENNEIEE
jgi:hypothetical protein